MDQSSKPSADRFRAVRRCLDKLPNGDWDTKNARTELTQAEEREAKWRAAIDKARRETASDPDNVWCRNATIILDAAIREE